MTRRHVYSAIDAERMRQDAKWSDRTQYARSAPHLLVLEEKLAAMRTLWYASERDALIAEFVKIAAIAVRALEEIDTEA